MQIGIYSYHEWFSTKNKFFDMSAYPIGEDLGFSYYVLKEILLRKQHRIDTLDIHPIDKYQKIIFLDYPNPSKINLKNLHERGIEMFLVIVESPTVRMEDWDSANHKYFKKIFSWDSKKFSGDRYIDLKLPNKIPQEIIYIPRRQKKLCVMINGNKSVIYGNELYTERKNALRWFETYHKNDFDLYGTGWNKIEFSGIWSRLNRFKKLRSMLCKEKHASYKGEVTSKRVVMSKYQFSICYENVYGFNGYITEKIFDSLFAGCIPVYLGAPDIADFFPDKTFIDKKCFPTYQELYSFLVEMSDDDYQEYIEKMKLFVKSEQIRIFSAEHFADTLINHIIN